MRNLLVVFALLLTTLVSAVEKGKVVGVVTDKDMNNEALPFANVFVKGTTIGVTTDFDGNYILDLTPGEWTVVYSFVGYETIEETITVLPGSTLEVNKALGASAGVLMDEVVVKVSVSKESVSALIAEQKKASVIKESIGAQQLSKVGVSNAAVATTKIAGVSKSASSSAVFIRGLGDRYLSTTLNHLPVPSDDVENKNINLDLFSTDILQNVGISKTYAVGSYSDQASGNVDIVSKKYSGNKFSVSFKGGINTNVTGSDFRVSSNNTDVDFGFYNNSQSLVKAISNQGWDSKNKDVIGNFGLSMSGGYKFEVFEKFVKLFATTSFSKSYDYRLGTFQNFTNNEVRSSFSDVEQFTDNTNFTTMLSLESSITDGSKLSFTSLFVNKTKDNLLEAGRNGLGEVRDQRPLSSTATIDYEDKGAFIRDQNVKQSLMFVNQLAGTHILSEDNKLIWGVGYNFVKANEPNRIRNEVNILTADGALNPEVEIINIGGFDQRKSGQTVKDNEVNAYIEDQITFRDLGEDGAFKLKGGFNFRNKQRDFNSLFVAAAISRGARGFTVSSVDDLSSAFSIHNFNNGTFTLKSTLPDTYKGSLNVLGAYADFSFGFEKLTGSFGLRYELDQIDVDWNVSGYVGRQGAKSNTYNNVLPSLNLKYELNEKNFLRFAGSLTNTLPEFKELAPFNYTSPTGRITTGNPELQKSDNYNFDVKWEAFPTSGELISVTGFYKRIKNPINSAIQRGSSGYFTYANTGKKADVFGLEFEGKLDVVDSEKHKLNTSFNVTKMWFEQDLLKDFQYKGKTTSGLQGASDLIFNSSLSFSTKEEKEFIATLSANYSSDKIAALGSQLDSNNPEENYNDEILEKGFWGMDLVVSKKLSEKLSLKLSGKNLLNPEISQTQNVIDENFVETTEIVKSYKRGNAVSLSVKYQL